MSCEIRPVACILNISAIKRCLFPTDDQRGGDSWLQTCRVSASPAGDIIIIANERRLVVLSSKWDSTTSLSMFQVLYSDTIHAYDKVKAVLCLPIVGHCHSSHIGPDWTCIVIGYDSGYVRFYTENCDLLLEEQFHNENITSIKCQSQHSPRPDILPELHLEELYIQYQSNVCVVNGQQLFTNLKTLRSQLAKAQAKGSPVETEPAPLNIKKWGYQDQASINDVVVVGLNMSSTFDHLLNASTCGGFDSKYRHTAPNSSLVLAAGSKPFLGYHYALEGVNLPVLSDVAKAVANKLKSALPGWLTGSKTNQEKEATAATQPVENMILRFGLCDLRRTGAEIILSPNKKLAAVTDSLGRVLLVDSFRGVTIRAFKGYREAQCAFLQVPDERRSKHRVGNKVANFLVIYSPKKGTLEIFTLQHGTKIATFSASKYSRLLYITHGLVGFIGTSKSKYICQFTCIFVDNDGQIKEIAVPFHYAVAEKNSKRARDIHLYKKLRHLVKCAEFDADKLQNETFNICSELKTAEIKSQTLEMLLASKEASSEIIANCLNCFAQLRSEDAEAETSDSLKTLCRNARALLDLYTFVTSPDEAEETNENREPGGVDTSMLEDKELENLQKVLDLASSVSDSNSKTARVRFSDNVSYTVAEFFSCFDLTKPEVVTLKTNLEDDALFRTSEVLFKKYISGEHRNFDKFRTVILSSGVPAKHLFDLVVHFWVNRDLDINLNLENDMNNFSATISMLVKIASKEIFVNSETDAISSFWEDVRENLGNSSRPFPALMAAILCKNVALKYELENSEDNIEVLTQENIQWSLLTGKLEDVSTLNIILSSRPGYQTTLMPKLSHNKVDVSLKYILQTGRGSVSELTAQWLTSCGVEPQHIVVNEILHRNSVKEFSESSTSHDKPKKATKKPEDVETRQEIEIAEGMHSETVDLVKSDPVFNFLNLLRRQFPYSLEAGTLLANMSWEYALSWRKDIASLGLLDAALKCLNCVTDNSVKRGLFHMVWNTHIKIVAEASCKLINKVGRLPKERLCQQDTGLTDKQITGFIGICTEFLDSFLEATQYDHETSKPSLKFEPIWENSGPPPLVELALQNRDIDYNLLHLHYQLSSVLYMITKFAIKHSKPVNNLFEPSLACLFFTDLQKKVDMNWNKSDIKINSSRVQFLHKVITASLETVTLDEDGQIYCKDHVKWMGRCLTLARIWNLNVDDLKRFQISQLYVSGYDSVAEELIPAVNELPLLGAELLKVAGKRLSQFLSSSPNLSENIAAISPALNRYIESLNGEWCSPGDLENIKTLASHAVRCLSEDQQELYKLAELLLDACNTLQEFN